MSEPEYIYQWMVCLKPAQWRELKAKYGAEKIGRYFGRVDRSYQAGLKPDRKTAKAALELYKMKYKLSDLLG